jgi:alpha-mannosidase
MISPYRGVLVPRNRKCLPVLLVCLALSARASGHEGPGHHPDLSEDPTLYVVGYAHLDTQWRWEYPKTITEYLSKTMRDNFALFEKYPNYTFNFTGSLRYKMMKEYYPEDYEKLKKYVAAGRWFAAGSSVEENDANNPSAESLIRQILYGSHFFRHEFGYTSAEFMLPDCFGFPASLPTVLAHCRLKGFVTQKLMWGSAAPVGGLHSPENTPAGIPFNVGIWEGPDGRGVIGALNPGSYVYSIRHDLSKNLPATVDPAAKNVPVDWPQRVQRNGEVSGLYTDYHFHGTGDTGGAPAEDSVKLMEAIVTRGKAVLPPLVPPASDQPTPAPGPEVTVGDGPLSVLASHSDQMFLDIHEDQTGGLPRYKGDLLLTEHSAGSITSQTYVKRWNRRGELLADAAERASVAAAWLGGRPYPLDRLNRAWELVLASQMHDILPGTSTPKAYEYAWNNQVLALNQFAGVLTSAAEAIASGLDTRGRGRTVVVYNALDIPREDVVEATLSFPAGVPKALRVVGPDGKQAPAQILSAGDGTARVLFLATVPSVGFAVYDIEAAAAPESRSALKVQGSTLENARYRVQVDANGDVASLYDKTLKKELLEAPARLAIQTEKPRDWPAWNMDWADRQKPPRAYVQGPAKIRIVEDGPVRVALEVAREGEGSRFVQTIRLAAGDAGGRVELSNAIDWKTGEASLKASFPLTAGNPEATYNWGIGTIRRGNNDPKKFEVPSHQWFDLTDASGSHGVTVLSDGKNGSDKPDDNTLRLTLLYTPGLGEGNGLHYNDQTTQDWGHHEFVYGLAGHAGDWRQAQTDWQAYRLSQPLAAFESPKHAGTLGKTFSLLATSNSRVRVLALKRAEDSDEVIVRMVEVDGKPAKGVRVAFGARPLAAARELDGTEQPVGPANLSRGELVADFGPYEPRTFAVKLGIPPATLVAPRSQPVALPYDLSVASPDGRPASGSFDAQGRALAAELLPREIEYAGVRFALAPAGDGTPSAVVARGQTIALPAGGFSRVFVLAASADGDQKATFHVGDKAVDVTVQDWSGFIGQWDNRTWSVKQVPILPGSGQPAPPLGTPPRLRMVWEYTGLLPGYIKRAPVAWFASHHHAPDGSNEPYAYSYLFAHGLEASPDAKTLTLPNNDKLRILAVTAVDTATGEVRPVQPLYDMLPPR